MTNGEKLISDFPYIEIKGQDKVFTAIQIDTTETGTPIIVYTEWWNGEYKEPTTKNDLPHNLCDSCTNFGCEFQSGIVRTKCAFYTPPQISIGEAIMYYGEMKKGWHLINPNPLFDFTIDILRKYQKIEGIYYHQTGRALEDSLREVIENDKDN